MRGLSLAIILLVLSTRLRPMAVWLLLRRRSQREEGRESRMCLREVVVGCLLRRERMGMVRREVVGEEEVVGLVQRRLREIGDGVRGRRVMAVVEEDIEVGVVDGRISITIASLFPITTAEPWDTLA